MATFNSFIGFSKERKKTELTRKKDEKKAKKKQIVIESSCSRN